MKRHIVVAIVAIVAATAVVIPSRTSAQGAPTGVLRIAVETLGNEALDATLAPLSSAKLYLPLMYDTLVGADETNSNLSKETGVARDWRVSADGKEYTFLLRQGIKFSNGDDLTADDVKFSLDRVTRPLSVASNIEAFRTLIDKIVVVDPYTVRIELKAPQFSFIYYVSSLVGGEAMILPKKYYERVGDQKFASAPIGSGPYRLKAYLPGQAIELEANPNHWSIGVPRFAEVDFMIVPEQGTRITMLRGDQADVISVGRQYVPDLQKAGFVIVTKPASNATHLIINNQWENGPLHDKRVRKAMELAIDRKTILDKLFGGAGELNRCWIVDVSYASRPKGLCDAPPYDPAAAKKLLAEAGYPNGFDVTYYSYTVLGVPEKLEMDQAIATYLRAVGIRANIKLIEYGPYRTQWRKPESLPNAIANNPTLSQVVASSVIVSFFGGKGLQTTTRGINPTADKALEAILTAATREEYAEYFWQAWKAFLDDSNVVMLFSLDAKYAANPKKVGSPWPMGASSADLGLRALVKR
jgi:peptide/nickel transport system substrate-binding protein